MCEGTHHATVRFSGPSRRRCRGGPWPPAAHAERSALLQSLLLLRRSSGQMWDEKRKSPELTEHLWCGARSGGWARITGWSSSVGGRLGVGNAGLRDEAPALADLVAADKNSYHPRHDSADTTPWTSNCLVNQTVVSHAETAARSRYEVRGGLRPGTAGFTWAAHRCWRRTDRHASVQVRRAAC